MNNRAHLGVCGVRSNFDFEPRLNEKRKEMIMRAKPTMKYIELADEEIAAFREKTKPL